MKHHVSVRNATEADLSVTAAIIAAEGEGEPEEWRERFADVLADPLRLFLVAEIDGRVVGFGHARQVHRPPSGDGAGPPSGWYLSGVTVAAQHRRMGVALALTEARLERLGAVPVHYAAEPENGATIWLHEKLGFKGVGTITLPGADRPLLLFRRDGGVG